MQQNRTVVLVLASDQTLPERLLGEDGGPLISSSMCSAVPHRHCAFLLFL